MQSIFGKKAARIHRSHRQNGIRGTEACPRIVVFRSNRHLSAQLVIDNVPVTVEGHTNDTASKVLAYSSTEALSLQGATIENAKKVGADLAQKAKDLKVENVVFDRNGYLYHGVIKALADALREGGLKF